MRKGHFCKCGHEQHGGKCERCHCPKFAPGVEFQIHEDTCDSCAHSQDGKCRATLPVWAELLISGEFPLTGDEAMADSQFAAKYGCDAWKAKAGFKSMY